MKIGFCTHKFNNIGNTKKQVNTTNTLNSNNHKFYNNGLNQLANINIAKIRFTGVQKVENYPRHTLDNYAGCLIGGAIGDAMGAKVETLSMDKIKNLYGSAGLRFIPKTNGKYSVTDDTQMTLFTADGLLKSYLMTKNLSSEPDYNIIYESYQKWYDTQVTDFDNLSLTECTNRKGLMSDSSLYASKLPGATCISALSKKIPGSTSSPINNSYGNGGLMRIAPVGLMYADNPALAFEIGIKCAALTHGHPDAYLPAGFQAALIANLISGKNILDAINSTMKLLENYKQNDYLKLCIQKAIDLSKTSIETSTAIENIGKGCNGSEAMGIAIYSVLKYPDSFKNVITTAVNHSGDSDTTAAIAGNIYGAQMGIKKMPRGWVENIEYLPWLYRFSKDIFQVVNMNFENTNNNQNGYMPSITERWDDDKFI